MSIATQITRISGNVTAALTAIGNKGVTVPSGSDSDDLATLIAAIPAGLEYESGTYTPSSDVSRPTISFAKSHSAAPVWVLMAHSGTSSTNNSNLIFEYESHYDLFGYATPYGLGDGKAYGEVFYVYYSTSASSKIGTSHVTISTASGTTNSSAVYWVSDSNFKPYTGSSSRYWRSGKTYRWIAVWKPTT